MPPSLFSELKFQGHILSYMHRVNTEYYTDIQREPYSFLFSTSTSR